MSQPTINLGDVEYPIFFRDGLLRWLFKGLEETVGDSYYYIIVDDFIYERYALHETQSGASTFYIVKGGKNNKTFFSAMKIFEDLDRKNIPRDVTIVAIGGGVVGDLGAFVASLWYRGVDLIHIPTTLLAAVDSSVGGKTAINFRSTVNAVGTYHHPKALIIDTALLLDLPAREISSGFGEIIKYAMLSGGDILQILRRCRGADDTPIRDLILLSLKEKERYVRGDVKESANRLFLNFGHTIGHAIEFSTVYEGRESLRHGEGVGLGMLAIFEVCREMGYLDINSVTELRGLLTKYGLPVQFASASLNIERNALVDKITQMAFKDKKRTREYLRLILLNEIGNPFIHNTDDISLIKLGVESVIG